MSEPATTVTEPSAVAPVYFSDRPGPGDTAALTQHLVDVIRRERAARGLPVDGLPAPERAPLAPASIALTEAPPSLPAPRTPPPAAPTTAAAEVPAGAAPQAAVAEAAEPSVAPLPSPPAPSIPIRWDVPGGPSQTSALGVERVEPIPGRPGDVYVVGRWPTGQAAVWEITTHGPWGRGSSIKIRWATGRVAGEWAAGLFQVERADRRADGLHLAGLWPQGGHGAIVLPCEILDGGAPNASGPSVAAAAPEQRLESAEG